MITNKIAWRSHAIWGSFKGLRPLDPDKVKAAVPRHAIWGSFKGLRPLDPGEQKQVLGCLVSGRTGGDSKGRSPLGPLNNTMAWLCHAIVLLLFVTPTMATPPLKVIASIPVLAQILEEIASGDVAITVLTKPGGSAHVFEPSATQIVEIRRAHVFFALPSLSHERGYLTAIQRLNKKLKVINLEEKKPARFAKDKNLQGDPHSWMAPEVLVTMVHHMVAVLAAENPAHAVVYRQRGQVIVQRIMAEDRAMREVLKQAKPAAFLTYHPSFGYFAAAYGLTQYALEREGKSISASYLRTVLATAKDKDVRTFLIHPGLDPDMVSRVTSFLPCHVVSVDVLNPDIFAVWRQLTATLVSKK